ncbi:transcription regulator HTH, apses-type DNA-binding domain-containing protein [Aspergillus cavernicola]|uniref:Cell pattern formation-associated protein stuA n=1 Tax=Aspergillus cavernicola TaxID=176166 RepID=A0ABR4ISK5_9EURO
MVRSLPKKNNPLVLADTAPAYEELLTRRRLGKTNLAVKPTQIGTSNATKPENLGLFEYAHLRAPLPRDLKGSEIFPSHSPQQHPETYFLMRRSKDGFVSATGMFKIAFPWAKLDEERSEREYLKSRDQTSEDEIAGNVWISPGLALELASEYKMYDWVRALLDPADIVQSPSSAKKQITPPPKFDLPPIQAPEVLAPSRGRSRRSASPSKKAGTPRKPRQTRAQKEASAAATNAANATLQSALDDSVSNADGEVNGDVLPSVEESKEELEVSVVEETKPTPKSKKHAITEGEEDDKVKIDIKQNASEGSGVQATQTTISVEMPISLPEAPSTAETQEVIAKAKDMVKEAVKLQEEPAESSAAAAKKRKTDEAELSDDEEDAEAKPLRTKRAKVLEEKLKRERVRNRALVGVTAAFALAASIPYFF